jgi:hypothetical protein
MEEKLSELRGIVCDYVRMRNTKRVTVIELDLLYNYVGCGISLHNCLRHHPGSILHPPTFRRQQKMVKRTQEWLVLNFGIN